MDQRMEATRDTATVEELLKTINDSLLLIHKSLLSMEKINIEKEARITHQPSLNIEAEIIRDIPAEAIDKAWGSEDIDSLKEKYTEEIGKLIAEMRLLLMKRH